MIGSQGQASINRYPMSDFKRFESMRMQLDEITEHNPHLLMMLVSVRTGFESAVAPVSLENIRTSIGRTSLDVYFLNSDFRRTPHPLASRIDEQSRWHPLASLQLQPENATVPFDKVLHGYLLPYVNSPDSNDINM